jgi:rSAM/selenodomain-associated transferase 1
MPRTGPASRLLVFAKAPRPGEVKTRLIPRLGPVGAAALHSQLIEHTLATANIAAPGAVELHGAPADDAFFRYCASRYGVSLVEQSGADLGERMHAAFEHAFEQSGCRSAVLIGSDSPALTPRHLRLAQAALDEGDDAVVAPAEDGGYVLIGMRRVDQRIFEHIQWSTDAVMAQTRSRLDALGWRTAELETLWDVDRPADYERMAAGGLLQSSVGVVASGARE